MIKFLAIIGAINILCWIIRIGIQIYKDSKSKPTPWLGMGGWPYGD